MSESILADLQKAVVDMKADVSRELIQKGLDEGLTAVDLLNEALVPALDEVGVLFRDGDYFLPDVLMSVKAYNEAYGRIENMLTEGQQVARGKVMLGTVEGDIHEIGKNILAALLQGNGFKVIDLGVQVTPQAFLEKARELQPDIIGMSSLLTTTMPAMKETIDLFAAEGLRDSVKIIIGGAPVNQAFADDIGADGYGEDAQSGVELAKRLMA
jgi:5-methyltetrahydrofolate--homocysteine methyltransferase